MPRIPHGTLTTTEAVREARRQVVEAATEHPLGFAATTPPDPNNYDFLFPTLQDDDNNLLPSSPQTTTALKTLGRIMEDPEADPSSGEDPLDSTIPAVYTYFGQFVDHDITLQVLDVGRTDAELMTQLLADDMEPLPPEIIRSKLRNLRTPSFDLDSIYGPPAPRDPTNPDKMLIGNNAPLNSNTVGFKRPDGKGLDNDVPREGRSDDPAHDRAARIGDPRNDENLIIAQLQLAFLKAHNALVDQGHTFTEARRILRQHYQYIVLHDFLKRVCDPAIVDDILDNGNRWFDGLAEPFFMPLEFSVAAYRFGHTMIRSDYNFNVNFNESGAPGTSPATLDLLFTFTAFSGQLVGLDTLPDNWIIEWERFVDDSGAAEFNVARKLDTKLAGAGDPPHGPSALFALQGQHGGIAGPSDAARLSVRNLLRGYRLRLPTGQAVAAFMGVPVLSADDIKAAVDDEAQVQALTDGGFLDTTPLWFYILAEANAAAHGNGNRLGPVGSTIVAEVLIGIARRSDDSILRQPGWVPSLPILQGDFKLADLLRFAGVLSGGTVARTYTVQPGDTMSSIAQQQLGDANRWPEIFVLNRALIANPDRIFPGQVLTLPSGAPASPAPRLYVVKPGDTLSKIAHEQLGDANRWTEIAALNKPTIPNPDRIFPNQVLVLPTDATLDQPVRTPAEDMAGVR